VFQLILDGQQRLTSVYALATGEPPPFYEGEKLYFDLYFNVANQEFSYFKKTTMQGAKEWLPVTPFLKIGLGDYLKAGGPIDTERRDLLFQFFDRLQQLDSIKSYTYYLDTLGEREMDEVVKIFNYVNSKGTRLSKSDLALSHICALWPEARQTMRTTQQEISKAGFWFELDFFVRLTNSVATGSGLYEPLYSRSVEDIKNAWARAKGALEYLINVLRFEAFIDSNKSLPSDMVLVPLIVYLSRNSNSFGTESRKRAFLHWMYSALMWTRYSSSAETKLNQDLEALGSDDPPKKLRDNIVSERGRIKVEGRDLASRTSRSAFYHMIYFVARANGATDWFNGLPLYSKLVGKSHGLQDHHIFPQAALYKTSRFNSNSTKDRDLVNEISNLAFLTAQANLKLSNRLPSKYLADVPLERRIAQQIPETPALWETDRYEEFLIERREQLAQAVNSFMDSLLAEGVSPPLSIEDYIQAGESDALEFKGSLRWDFRQKSINKSLEKVVAKTIAAFMNSHGGTLVIGVSDEGQALGLEFDITTLGSKKSIDGWELTLRNVLNNYLSKEIAALVDLSFSEYLDKTVALVHANQARKPIYLTDGQLTEFYVRSGNSTEQLNVKQSLEYCNDRFPPDVQYGQQN